MNKRRTFNTPVLHPSHKTISFDKDLQLDSSLLMVQKGDPAHLKISSNDHGDLPLK